jgi:hypothetical protein
MQQATTYQRREAQYDCHNQIHLERSTTNGTIRV